MLNLTHEIFNEFIKCNNIRGGIEDNGGQHPFLSGMRSNDQHQSWICNTNYVN